VEACASADPTGYTRLTEESGDEVAAGVSLKLVELVNEAASRDKGHVVKMLGVACTSISGVPTTR
jgi:class 3 adenylate cyclase